MTRESRNRRTAARSEREPLTTVYHPHARLHKSTAKASWSDETLACPVPRWIVAAGMGGKGRQRRDQARSSAQAIEQLAALDVSDATAASSAVSGNADVQTTPPSAWPPVELPRITKENAAQWPPPSLNSFIGEAARGQGSEPATWYWQMTGDSTWDRLAASYKIERDKWHGWAGKNARHAEDRRKAKATARAAASAQLDASNLQLDQHVAALVQPLLNAIDADGTVPFHSMVPSFECERDSELMLLPAWWRDQRGLVTEAERHLAFPQDETRRSYEAESVNPIMLETDPPRPTVRLPAVSLPTLFCETYDSRVRIVDGRPQLDATAESARHDWTGLLAQQEPHFAVWNGPKLAWPGYFVHVHSVLDRGYFKEEELELGEDEDESDELWGPSLATAEAEALKDLGSFVSQEGLVDDSIFTCDRAATNKCGWRGPHGWLASRAYNRCHVFDYGDPMQAQIKATWDRTLGMCSFEPSIIISRVLSALEERLDMHGRRLWWRSIFYAPPGFSKISTTLPHPRNVALIAHMRLAAVGETGLLAEDRVQLLGRELRLLSGLPLERQSCVFNMWMTARHDFDPRLYSSQRA